MSLSRLPLSYCTNVHPGQTVSEVLDGINTHTAAALRQFNRPMAAGLWLSRSVVTELIESPNALEELGQTLWQHDLSCYTLNTFPYGNFHSDRVKEKVYLPDWTTPERLNYTTECAQLLAQLIPESAEGSLSTVPLGGRMNPCSDDFDEQCLTQILTMARQLEELHASTGRRIRLAIEPEPLCHLSSVPNDVIPWFARLFEQAAKTDELEVVQEYIGVCLDVCHQAVEFEDVSHSIDLLEAKGIRINKVHITNAVEIQNPANNEAGRAALLAYVEPRYLHQTYARFDDGHVETRVDLTADDINRSPADDFLQAESWRVHFHVPVFAESLGPLRTTRADLQAALQRVSSLPYSPHLEVETYTWPVMPDADEETAEKNLANLIAGELDAAATLIESCRV